MCDLIVGKPDISVGYPRIKSSTLQRKPSWDNRYEVEGGKTPLADTTTPPAESSPGCGMCVRSSGQETSEPTQKQQQSSQQQPPKSSISPANCVPTIMDVKKSPLDSHFMGKPTRLKTQSCVHSFVDTSKNDKIRHTFVVQPATASTRTLPYFPMQGDIYYDTRRVIVPLPQDIHTRILNRQR
ncbi:uncharacterized protein NPIL_187171 [Nephila pilipes]|uniref:Uncharacterized protein n=1 Tax=Nephila pilipes TaxID=299642 RepID=A0A8X6P8B3_NEPPI|nr:uncharacterized protein NPIL_187171 [Nephila pilipes]